MTRLERVSPEGSCLTSRHTSAGQSSVARQNHSPAGNVDPAAARHATPRDVFRLQRMVGNSAVRRMLATGPSHRAPVVPVVQRYEAGEHSQFGDVYEVKQDEIVGRIAVKLGVKSTELRDANKDKLKSWTTPDGRTVRGFNAGDVIIIPPRTSGGGGKPAADAQQMIIINTVPFTYGQVISLGDFYATPDAMHQAPVAELEELKRLLIKDAKKPGSVSTGEWNLATGGRYLTLLFDNASHFAPPDATLVPPGGAATADHKSEWERWHRQALDLAVAGDREAAMAANAFGDHFLTDAFAAGHLFNVPDLTEHFSSLLAGHEDAFFTAVANRAWADPGLAQFVSGFESTAWHGMAITTAGRFLTLLTGIHAERPDVILQTIVNVVHDKLNTDGVEVVNDLGTTWTLFGDKSLDAKSLEEGKRAVAQSQQDVLTTLSATKEKPLDHDALNAAVWAHVPHPTAIGATSIQQAVKALADPTLQSTIDAVVAELILNIPDIIAEVVRLGRLQPAGNW